MSTLKHLLTEFFPLAGVICFSVFVWSGYTTIQKRRNPIPRPGTRYRRQILLVALIAITVFFSILALPVAEGTQKQLLNVIGLTITVIVTLSSTTFVANMMASMMLRMVKNFQIGDFIEVGEFFGRVTERGLFHTEIQTSDSNLTTLPNIFLVSNPVKVTRHTGTLVSATVSLGYDHPPAKVESCLIYAAKKATLEDPFVHVLELGDFSISYQIAGFLSDTKQLLTARSNLRKMMIDCLHNAEIEIVSPSFMAQRPLAPGTLVIPNREAKKRSDVLVESVEDKVFNKADEAVKLTELSDKEDKLVVEINELRTKMNGTRDPHERVKLSGQIAKLERGLTHLSDKKRETEGNLSKDNIE